MTMPLAAVLPPLLDQDGADRTRRLTEQQTVVRTETEVVTGPRWPERLRRATLLSAAALACGATIAAYPWFGSLGLVLVTWVLRSGSLAASAAGERRRVRGRKWYDGAQFLVRTPYDLVRSIPVTAMLVLWSAGLAVAAALLCYAFVAGEGVTLAVCGTTFAVAVWTGPGGARVRMPLSRVVNPLSREWRSWAAATVIVVIAAVVVGLVAEQRGTQWVPGQDRPLSASLAP